MKLSRTSIYALQAVIHMADAGEGPSVAAHRMAKAHGLPTRFRGKVLRPLVRAQILRGVRGPNGGYRLARPANKITVLEVVEAVDGPIRGDAPFTAEPQDELTGRLQAACDDAAERVRKVLGRARISDLAGPKG